MAIDFPNNPSIDAWTAYEEATEKAKTRKKQEHICQELYKKVGPGHFFGI